MDYAFPFTPDQILAIALIFCLILLAILSLALLRNNRQSERDMDHPLISQLISQQGQMMQQLHHQAQEQNNHLGHLNERLASVKDAQTRLEALNENVASLQDILSNKQARGLFGESQLMDLVGQALPASTYDVQSTLSNGMRVDCLIHLPSPPGPMAVDAKFPLEYWRALNHAKTPEAEKQARSQFSRMMKKHLGDIADKYLLPGETAESAILFLPSEAIYADIHSHMPDVIEYSQQVRVYITSPSTLMAVLNTMRAILRDTQLREETSRILKDITLLTQDVERLDNRVLSLKKHYDAAEEDMRLIQISTQKISTRAHHITDINPER